MDRSRKHTHIGIAGDAGHYYSLRHERCTASMRTALSLLAPRLQGHELDRAYINMYPSNSFIPANRCVCEGPWRMAVVPLQSHPVQGVTWYDAMDKAHHVIDEIGRALIFESLAVMHAVRVVTQLRLSAVFLYR
ncbi:hypothetical protein HDC30_002386 [Pseudomonas sp. JAI115]|uniref:hypothetical protein n=1 Tax=Pseudomonas sp. JAI115 TaxID=2723061 RepID=UPI0016174EA2|nr:hypothetical protein [Pseudomonas sp. JAI115]MBB6155163.1 hypothetical protein [Pseudomonas sp. JAI115]